MEPKWEVFEGRQNRQYRSKELRVTLGHGATIYLNSVAWEALGRPAAVEFMIDGNRNLIGIRPTDPRRHNAFNVRDHSSGNYKRISAAAFCKHIRLRVKDETVLFDKAELLPDGSLALPLDSRVTVGRGSR